MSFHFTVRVLVFRSFTFPVHTDFGLGHESGDEVPIERVSVSCGPELGSGEPKTRLRDV